jgi:hypothetical protein
MCQERGTPYHAPTAPGFSLVTATPDRLGLFTPDRFDNSDLRYRVDFLTIAVPQKILVAQV